MVVMYCGELIMVLMQRDMFQLLSTMLADMTMTIPVAIAVVRCRSVLLLMCLKVLGDVE